MITSLALGVGVLLIGTFLYFIFKNTKGFKMERG